MGEGDEEWKVVEEGWKKLRKRVEEMLEKVEIGTKRKRKKGMVGWEYREKKRRVREKLKI